MYQSTLDSMSLWKLVTLNWLTVDGDVDWALTKDVWIEMEINGVSVKDISQHLTMDHL